MTQSAAIRVALSADFFDGAGRLRYDDIGLDLLAADGRFAVGRLEEHRAEISPDQLVGHHAAIVLGPRVTAASLARADQLAIIARFGVGYDSVDVAACTARDVLLTITAGAVDHSVAEATVGWMLALSHHMRTKDRLVREAQWDVRSQFMGSELRGRTLGIVGFGGIGRAVVRLVASFGMQTPLVYDPFITPDELARLGAAPAALDELLARSDYVSLHCPLNEATRGLIGRHELALMKPTAYLINTARGGIVDEDALYDALAERRIAGAAIDCFVGEPLAAPPRLAEFDNVLLAPHSIAWTHELFRDIGRAACQGIIDLASGRRPRGIVNPEVYERPVFQAKIARVAASVKAV
jgi:phosphoglycerate dehydrogenase-like enzyme